MRTFICATLAFAITGCVLQGLPTSTRSTAARVTPRAQPSATNPIAGDSSITSPVKVVNKDGSITTETTAENLAKAAAKVPSPKPSSIACFQINPLTGRAEWMCNPNTVEATPSPASTLTPAPVITSPTPSPAGQVLRRESVTNVAGGTVEISVVREADGTVSAYAASTFTAPVTVAFKLQPQNLDTFQVEASGALTPTKEAIATVQNTKRKVMTMRLRDPAAPWNLDYTDAWFFGDVAAKADGTVYKLPFEKGTTQTITQGPGGAFSHQAGSQEEYGVDWGFATGTKVRAARGGTVAAYHDGISIHFTDPSQRNLLDANWLIVQHDDGTMGGYWHLQNAGIKVRVGQRVEAGDVIAISGDTGFTTAPHLHFGVYSPAGMKPHQTVPFAFQLTPASNGTGPTSSSFTAFE